MSVVCAAANDDFALHVAEAISCLGKFGRERLGVNVLSRTSASTSV